jgi:nucleolar complex protein 3
LKSLFVKDIDGEVSYEGVLVISKALAGAHYNVPEMLVRVLENVKVRVHADEAKNIRKQAKKERRKRKRAEDDIEANLMEANATNKLNVKKLQADVLHEICLIYFRIIKQKVGFRLLPPTLEGLARVTHLINIDTVDDLLTLMRGIVQQTAPVAPLLIRLHCVYCALKTLSGPGQV